MKKNIFTAIILVFFITLTGAKLSAQKKTDYIPEKGHWQLVSNIHEKKVITVQFYSAEGDLMYEETVTNRKLNVNRKEVRRQLYYALQEAYEAWAATHVQVQTKDLIAKRR